jgi:hypothetical protein
VELLELSGARHRYAFMGEPTVPDPTRANPRAVRWDRIDVGADDRTLRIEYIHGIMDDLHSSELNEGDEEVRVTVFLGSNPEPRDAPGEEPRGYTLVGISGWTSIETKEPVGRRYINDGAER